MNTPDIYRVQQTDTYTLYTKNGLKHRTTGPALIIDEAEYYYINGEPYSKEEHQNYRKAAVAYERNIWNEEYAYSQAVCAPNGIYVNA